MSLGSLNLTCALFITNWLGCIYLIIGIAIWSVIAKLSLQGQKTMNPEAEADVTITFILIVLYFLFPFGLIAYYVMKKYPEVKLWARQRRQVKASS